jgi:uncharacterized protein
MKSKSIDIVLKITERCNLACTYCYFFFSGDQSYLQHSPVIKSETIDQLVLWLKQATDELDIDDINIGFHGGEPLLMKKQAFDEMCLKLTNCGTDKTKVSLGIQTNAVLIDEDWISLFEKHGVDVGISIDGPKYFHDLARVDHKGHGSYNRVVNGLRLLQKAAGEGRIAAPGALMVINTDLDPAEAYDHIVTDLGIPSLNFLFPREGNDTKMVIDPSVWRPYMRKLIDHWTKEDTDKVGIRHLSEPLKALLSEKGAEWNDEGNANLHNVITITSDGELGPDDNLKPLDPKFQYTGQTIFNISFAEFLASDLWQDIIAGNALLPQKCQICQWQRICGGGIPFNRYSKVDGFARESVFCEALDETYLRLTEYCVAHGVTLDEISERLSKPVTCSPYDLLNAPKNQLSQ